MTLSNVLKAISAKLTSLFPEKHVHIDEIPREADDSFYIRIIEASEEKKLDRRKSRLIQFEVIYFLASKSSQNYFEWAEQMFDSFNSIRVLERVGEDEQNSIYRVLKVKNHSARPSDDNREFHFTADIEFSFVAMPEAAETMGFLNQDNSIKE